MPAVLAIQPDTPLERPAIQARPASMSIADERTPDLTLDYGRPEPAAKRWWDRARAEVQDRIDGLLEYAGPR